MTDADPTLLFEIEPGRMKDQARSIVVRRYLFGQKRIQLCDARDGGIVAEL